MGSALDGRPPSGRTLGALPGAPESPLASHRTGYMTARRSRCVVEEASARAGEGDDLARPFPSALRPLGHEGLSGIEERLRSRGVAPVELPRGLVQKLLLPASRAAASRSAFPCRHLFIGDLSAGKDSTEPAGPASRQIGRSPAIRSRPGRPGRFSGGALRAVTATTAASAPPRLSAAVPRPAGSWDGRCPPPRREGRSLSARHPRCMPGGEPGRTG